MQRDPLIRFDPMIGFPSCSMKLTDVSERERERERERKRRENSKALCLCSCRQPPYTSRDQHHMVRRQESQMEGIADSGVIPSYYS